MLMVKHGRDMGDYVAAIVLMLIWLLWKPSDGKE